MGEMKLYKVQCVGRKACYYVIAEDTVKAYQKVLNMLNKEDWFPENNRELRSIDVFGTEIDNYKDIFEIYE